MKRLVYLFLALGLAACAKDEAQEVPPINYQTQGGQMENTVQMGNQKSTMLTSKKAISLSSTTMDDNSVIQLSCGCEFKVVAESFTGDTNAIKFTQFPTPTAGAYRVTLQFSGNKSAAKGNYSARLAFLNTGDKGDYRDTITVNYTL